MKSVGDVGGECGPRACHSICSLSCCRPLSMARLTCQESRQFTHDDCDGSGDDGVCFSSSAGHFVYSWTVFVVLMEH